MAPRQVVRRGGFLSAARLAVLVLLVAGCAQPGRPPVEERSPVFGPAPGSYEVQAGDTLYSIAWRFGLDHRALAQANGIRAPYTIYVGQRLRLAAQAPPPSAASPKQPSLSAAERPSAAAPTVTGWRPPSSAAIARGYGQGNRGLDYRLEPGDDIAAAAAGEVVYAGSGLGGYRHLVIVKHDPEYLSAYSFDRDLAVREGQPIKAGAPLAAKEGGGRRAGTLHFEIRRDGDPVDPRPLLERAR